MSEELRLNDSQLGSQEYWNEFYQREMQNFGENHNDTGECWFDDSDAERKVVDFFCRLVDDGEVSANAKVLDLGTGNGHLLFELYDTISSECPHASLEYNGVDYSPSSVEFARQICGQKYPHQQFSFGIVDFISKECPFLQSHAEKFDVVFDKGTLDAIALNNDPVPGFNGAIGTQVYAGQVSKLMHSGSLLIITSCNFTEDELTKLIVQSGESGFVVWRKIKYPSFKFGGAQGSTICSIAFIKQ